MTTTTSPKTLSVEIAPLDDVTFDSYRDIHKGIRAGLFGVTLAIGNTDPGETEAVEAVAEQLHDLVTLLVSHAEHEEAHVQPFIERFAPTFGAKILDDHADIEGQMASLELLADRAIGVPDLEGRRRALHRLYLGMAGFTADYLVHQSVEEYDVMPALCRHMPVEEVIAMHQGIIASIPPEDMVKSLALMIPSMNVEDRVELFTGMRMSAPPEAFNGVFGLAATWLPADQYAQLKTRLGVA